MSQYVIPAPEPVTLPVVRAGAGDARFPVRRCFCVGRNYAEHAREMGHDPDREPPFFFSKPADALVESGSELPFPTMTDDLHHEIELVVAVGRGGADIPVETALEHVYGYAVGLDMTRRDVQAEAKKMGRPWDLAKGFDRSAPCSAVHPASEIGHPASGPITLHVNRELRQSGDLAQQIWAVPEVIAYLSRYVELAPGDLIMTGTPAGVTKVVPGDELVGAVAGVGEVTVRYLPR
jgi:fumarylpyruvate hydrolase